jgi:putative phosphoesterase
MPHGTAFEGKLYAGRLKTKQSKAAIPVPQLVRPVLENWRRQCADSSPDALMFPTFGRGKRKGQAVPRWGKNFLAGRIRPIARKLGIPNRLITFQVMRRTLGTDMQNFGSLKDIQSMLRHGSSVTTNDIYVQPIDQNVLQAANSRTDAVLKGWNHILHAGDVGDPGILYELRSIAPLTAIRGNVDVSGACAMLPATATVELGGCRFYLVHSVYDLFIDPREAGIAMVVCGHSHRAGVERRNGVVYLNPGSAGARRFDLPATLAKVKVAKGEVHPRIVTLLAAR